jgi:hypothetical protein
MNIVYMFLSEEIEEITSHSPLISIDLTEVQL